MGQVSTGTGGPLEKRVQASRHVIDPVQSKTAPAMLPLRSSAPSGYNLCGLVLAWLKIILCAIVIALRQAFASRLALKSAF
jgi:hypothetical protein